MCAAESWRSIDLHIRIQTNIYFWLILLNLNNKKGLRMSVKLCTQLLLWQNRVITTSCDALVPKKTFSVSLYFKRNGSGYNGFECHNPHAKWRTKLIWFDSLTIKIWATKSVWKVLQQINHFFSILVSWALIGSGSVAAPWAQQRGRSE